MKGALIDIGHSEDDGQSHVDLYVKGKKLEVIKEAFDPYFYFEGAAPKHELLKKAERVGGLWKVFVRAPGDVPKLREELAKQGRIYEYDIPYTQRYLIDHDIVPFSMYEWGGGKPKKAGGEYEPTRIAFDIETYNPRGMPEAEKDPIVMVSAHDGKKGGVYTWKKINLPFVKSYKNEEEMLKGFVSDVGQDVVYTYNGDNFDLPYVKTRLEKLGIKKSLGTGEGIALRQGMRGLKARIPGRVHIDAYRGMVFLSIIGALKLPRYTLEDVYKELTGKEKLDIETKNLWKIWDKADKKEMEELATYSLQDAEAAYELGEQLLPLYTALSKLINQMPFDVSRMSSSQIVELLLLRMAKKRGEIAPNRPVEGEFKARINKQLKGAFVKEPEPGLHEDLAVLDFKGLYPSIIISHNIDPGTLDCGCCKKPFESPMGQKFCRKKKGLIPEMLEKVTGARAEAKKKLKKASGKEKKLLDAENKALKIAANATYGYLNYARARWYSFDCAEATTAWGRKFIKDAAAEAEKRGFKVIYGDSITSDRFVTLLDPTGVIQIKNIGELFNENRHNAVKVGGKEVIPLKNHKALTANPKTKKPEWQPITEVIRHKTKKKIFRVNQKYGETRVTKDHSLIINKRGGYVCAKPEEITTEHLARINQIPTVKKIKKIDVYEWIKDYSHTTTYKGREKTASVSADKKFVWFNWTTRKKPVKLKRHIPLDSKEFDALLRLLALYIGEGSSSTPETTKTRWGASIANSDTKLLKQLKTDYHLLFENTSASIVSPNKNKRTLRYSNKTLTYQDKTHKLQMMSQLAAVVFKQFCGQKSRGKKIPEFIFHLPKNKQKYFLDWLLLGDGSKSFDKRYSQKYCEDNFAYTTNSQQLIGGVTLLLKQLGINFSLQYRPSKKVYTVKTSKKHNSRMETTITQEQNTDYVYDLSVSNSHMFVDSCGQILLHNTDSVFMLRGGKSKDEVLKFLKDYNDSLPGTMELELEGFYPRGIFVTKKEGGAAKKRYALIREDGQVEIKGLEFVRRDWSQIAKKTQREVIQKVLENDVEGAKALVLEKIEQVRKNEVPIEEYVIRTQLKRRIDRYASQGPHVRAAKRLEEAGEKVGKGTLIEYVVCQGAGNIGDRSYSVRMLGKRKPDVDYYVTHQLLPAVMKILAELGISADELTTGTKQSGLGAWA
ncbi:MAG: ribonuclease H-like domain-containing protein [Candidatus Diapherotrites archaeon]|nr:ribonuclease H-like domain-containing protein [Candidatus Diapherotrites archaeon]